MEFVPKIPTNDLFNLDLDVDSVEKQELLRLLPNVQMIKKLIKIIKDLIGQKYITDSFIFLLQQKESKSAGNVISFGLTFRSTTALHEYKIYFRESKLQVKKFVEEKPTAKKNRADNETSHTTLNRRSA